MRSLYGLRYVPIAHSMEPPVTRLRALMLCVLASEPCDSSPLFGELQEQVRASAAELRDSGSMPEEMVIALKRATSRGALRASTSREDDLHYRMILWSVREFFRYDS